MTTTTPITSAAKARASITQSDLDRAVKAAAKAPGMAVTVTAPDGKTFTFTPTLDKEPESGQRGPKKWRPKG